MLTQQEILKLEYDKKQMQFALDGTLIINQKIIDENTPLMSLINESNFWICPFCLETSNKFIIENKGLIKCPNCSNFMRLKTLIFVKDCTNQEYANWVFNYRLSGFFKKINFEGWTKKLKELGISYEFWEEYKKLKGTYEEEEKRDKEEFTQEETELIINTFMAKIKEGLNREKLIIQLEQENIDFDINIFDYCFNEAQLKIKNSGVNNV